MTGYLSIASPIDAKSLQNNFLATLGGTLAGVQDEYVLVLTPISSNVNCFAAISYKEY